MGREEEGRKDGREVRGSCRYALHRQLFLSPVVRLRVEAEKELSAGVRGWWVGCERPTGRRLPVAAVAVSVGRGFFRRQ